MVVVPGQNFNKQNESASPGFSVPEMHLHLFCRSFPSELQANCYLRLCWELKCPQNAASLGCIAGQVARCTFRPRGYVLSPVFVSCQGGMLSQPPSYTHSKAEIASCHNKTLPACGGIVGEKLEGSYNTLLQGEVEGRQGCKHDS